MAPDVGSCAVQVRDVLVGITVSDLERSRAWYTRLFGHGPDLEPFPGNVEYQVGDAWVQISEGEVRPSSWSLILGVEDAGVERERLRAAGVDATEVQTVPDVIRFFDLTDPDGNAMRWFEVLTDDPAVTGEGS